MASIAVWLRSSILLATLLGSGLLSHKVFPLSTSLETGDDVSTQLELRRSLAVRVFLASDTFIGSGLIVSSGDGGYWVATNRHVAAVGSRLCVQTSDGELHPASAGERISRQSTDLAFLWFASVKAYPEGKAHLLQESQVLLPALVDAAGFLGSSPNHDFVTRRGLIVKLLDQPIEQGLQLTYTSDVEKGMSGGPIFLDGRTTIIGINSWHSNHLWEGPILDRNGRSLSPFLNRLLSHLALGIPSSAILEEMRTLKTPKRTPKDVCKA